MSFFWIFTLYALSQIALVLLTMHHEKITNTLKDYSRFKAQQSSYDERMANELFNVLNEVRMLITLLDVNSLANRDDTISQGGMLLARIENHKMAFTKIEAYFSTKVNLLFTIPQPHSPEVGKEIGDIMSIISALSEVTRYGYSNPQQSRFNQISLNAVQRFDFFKNNIISNSFQHESSLSAIGACNANRY
jgi:hypothetical protein